MIDRSRKQILGYHSGDTGAMEIRELQGLGYDSVILPFLALLIGFCAALFQLGIEAVTICKKKCSNDEEAWIQLLESYMLSRGRKIFNVSQDR